MRQTDLALISTIFVRWGSNFHEVPQCTQKNYHQFDQHPQMLRKYTFFCAILNHKKFPTTKKFSWTRKTYFFLGICWMLVKLVEKLCVKFHVKLEPQRTKIEKQTKNLCHCI
jgi:hypothetical protein